MIKVTVRSTLVLFLCFGTATALHSQGTLYFMAHLTGNSSYTGDALFSLTTNYFTYDVVTSYGFYQAAIRSPWPDPTASTNYTLSIFGCTPPLGGVTDGNCEYRGHLLLSDQDIADLEAGRWYVYAAANPPGYMQGQILSTSIPEPGSLPLAVVGMTLFCLVTIAKFGPGRRKDAPS